MLFEKPLIHIGSHLLFIHNLSFYTSGSINGVNWSLATEMQFYLLMCIFGKFIFTARLWTFSILFIVVSWIWRYLAIIYPYYPVDLPFTHTLFNFVTQLVGMLDEFAFGLILAKLILKLLIPFYYLGTISYGIYLWHLPIIESLKKIQWLTPVQFMLMTLALTIILSSLSYHFFEKPIMQRLKK